MNEKLLEVIDQARVIYCDMDDVLFHFQEQTKALERFAVEKGFFANLRPKRKNIMAIKTFIGYGAKVKILSATPNEQADKDKLIALAKYLPEIAREDIIFSRLGEDKSKYVEDMNGALLFDDYTENLIKWKANGGLAVKVVNDYDNAVGKHTRNNIPYVRTLLDLVG